MTIVQLKKVLKDNNVPFNSKMNKADLEILHAQLEKAKSTKARPEAVRRKGEY
jgi:hypothetical protein